VLATLSQIPDQQIREEKGQGQEEMKTFGWSGKGNTTKAAKAQENDMGVVKPVGVKGNGATQMRWRPRPPRKN